MIIRDFLSSYKNYIRHDGNVGIEIETETLKRYQIPEFIFWSHHPDGSLRNNGVEYVLKVPVKIGKQLEEALNEWDTKTKKINFIKDSVTTSVHVHINILNETFLTLGNFLTLYTLYENLLVRYSGDDRKSNLFCLPICDAEETYKNIVSMFKHIEKYNYKGMIFGEQQTKYAALNLSSIGTFGSIEVRSFRGSTDVKEIETWINILFSMMDFSKEKDLTPRVIMERFKNNPENLITSVFGKYRKDISQGDVEKKLIKKNVFFAASIAYSVADWTKINLPKDKKKLTEKELNQYSVSLFKKSWNSLLPNEQEYVYEYAERESIRRNTFTNATAEMGWEVRPAEMVDRDRRQRDIIAEAARMVLENPARAPAPRRNVAGVFINPAQAPDER